MVEARAVESGRGGGREVESRSIGVVNLEKVDARKRKEGKGKKNRRKIGKTKPYREGDDDRRWERGRPATERWIIERVNNCVVELKLK